MSATPRQLGSVPTLPRTRCWRNRLGIRQCLWCLLWFVAPTRFINTLRVRGGQGKPALVLLHGWAGGLALWRKNFAGLAEHFDVWAVDFIGWGLSSRTPLPGDMGAVVEQKVQNLKLWSEAVGLSSFTLLGHSLGGYIAGRFALEYPALVTRLVLACPSDVMPDERKDTLTYKAAFALEEMMGSSIPLSVVRRFEAIGAGPWLLRRVYNNTIADEEIEYLLACAALPSSGEAATIGRNRHQAFLWHDLARLCMRVDFIIGDRDETIPPKLGQATGAEMAFSRLSMPGRMVVVREADHAVYTEVDAFNSAVISEGALLFPAVDHPWQSVVAVLGGAAAAPPSAAAGHNSTQAESRLC